MLRKHYFNGGTLRKAPYWSYFAHNFINSGYFYKIFGTYLQKGLVYFYTNEFLPHLLFLLSYNPSLNRQISSLIDAQAHLWTQLLRARFYRLSKILRCRISPTIQLTDKVKFQSYRLSFLGFFIGKQYTGPSDGI